VKVFTDESDPGVLVFAWGHYCGSSREIPDILPDPLRKVIESQ